MPEFFDDPASSPDPQRRLPAIRREARRRHIRGLTVTVCTVVVVLAGTGLGIGLAASQGHAGGSERGLGPAAARGLFPQRLFASNQFGGPRNHDLVRLVASVAQAPDRQTLVWTLPTGFAGEYLYVDCSGGRATISFDGGATTQGPCHGVNGVTSWAIGPHHESVTVRVSSQQAHPWGTAIYSGPF
jgi:hypothetical protein